MFPAMESADGVPSECAYGIGGSVDKDATLAVKVALNIRPLIGLERLQGCKDCITVVAGEPQVRHEAMLKTQLVKFGPELTTTQLVKAESLFLVLRGL